MLTIFWVIIGAVAALVLWVIVIFNGLISLKNRTKEAWSDIDVQLKRRYDLIPNLIATVKGYAKHEDRVFTKVTEARNQAINAKNPKEQSKAENMLAGTLKTLFAVAENYPQLRANANFLELQRELSDTEDKIQASRRFYNGNVRDFNIKTEVFPSSLIAKMFSFKQFDLFELESAKEKEAPKVDFGK
ncbi:LemA family protein [Patescibacteria group bacterium]